MTAAADLLDVDMFVRSKDNIEVADYKLAGLRQGNRNGETGTLIRNRITTHLPLEFPSLECNMNYAAPHEYFFHSSPPSEPCFPFCAQAEQSMTEHLILT